MRVDGFLAFLREWFRAGPAAMREFGLLVEDIAGGGRFRRESMVFEGFKQSFWPIVRRHFYESNLFMGVGYWESGELEPPLGSMLYDRLTYDFDSEGDPRLAIDVALEFTRLVRDRYGGEAVVVKSGFKGAHVHVPLKQPVPWEDYQVIWKALLKLLPPEKQVLCDFNMLQWNRIARVPMTINYKDGRRAWAWIIQPSIKGWLDFKWSLLEPLDPSGLPVAKVRVEIPLVEKHYIDPGENQAGASQAGSRYSWVEKVVEKGLPDGRKRFILYVLSAYLVNVKRLDEDEAMQVVQEFLDNSCRNYGRCEKVYESFIRGDLQRVKSKGLRPATLEKLSEKDPELHSLIQQVLSQS
jgi:hypothetical protein